MMGIKNIEGRTFLKSRSRIIFPPTPEPDSGSGTPGVSRTRRSISYNGYPEQFNCQYKRQPIT